MRFWRWIVDLFMGKRHETPPDDVRFYETLRRDQIEKAARDATGGVNSRGPTII